MSDTEYWKCQVEKLASYIRRRFPQFVDETNGAVEAAVQIMDSIDNDLAHRLHPGPSKVAVSDSSLLELEGLGAEIWAGVDVKVYIDELRGAYIDESHGDLGDDEDRLHAVPRPAPASRVEG